MEYPYREEYGDGVAVQFTFVKNGLLYTRSGIAETSAGTDAGYEVGSLSRRLRPGQEEEWKLVIKLRKVFPPQPRCWQ